MGGDAQIEVCRADGVPDELLQTPHVDAVLSAIRAELRPRSGAPALGVQGGLVDIIEPHVLEQADRVHPNPVPFGTVVAEVVERVEDVLPIADDHLLDAATDDRVSVVDRRTDDQSLQRLAARTDQRRLPDPRIPMYQHEDLPGRTDWLNC